MSDADWTVISNECVRLCLKSGLQTVKISLQNLGNGSSKLAKFVSFNNPDGERKEAIHNGHEKT